MNIDRDIHDPYGKLEDNVQYADKVTTFFDITLQEQILQPIFYKQQWIESWQQNIHQSVQ